MQNIYIPVILILIAIAMGAVFYARKKNRDLEKVRKSFENLDRTYRSNYEKGINELKSIHRREMIQVQSTGGPIASTNVKEISLATETAADIIETAERESTRILHDAEQRADAILSEAKSKSEEDLKQAQQKAQALLAEQEADLQRNMVDVTIEVVRRTMGKTLSKKDHKDIIYDSLREALK